MQNRVGYFYRATDRLVEMYDDLVQYALNDIVDRIMKTGVISSTAQYRIFKLQELGYHLEKIQAYIKKMTKYSDEEINQIFQNAGIFLYKPTMKLIIDNGQKEPFSLETSKYIRDVFNYYLSSTKGYVHNLTRTTAKSSQKLLIDKLDQVHFRVISGMQSYSQAIVEAVKEIGKSDLKVEYPSGHKDNLDVAVRRAVVTGVNKCYGDLNLIRAKESGYNHVLVSSHLGARHIENPNPEYLSHDIWQGQVYKVDWNKILVAQVPNSYGYEGA